MRNNLFISYILFSFYNWKTNEVASSDSANYWVIANSPTGIRFMNRKDRNIVNVDPQVGMFFFITFKSVCFAFLYFFI